MRALDHIDIGHRVKMFAPTTTASPTNGQRHRRRQIGLAREAIAAIAAEHDHEDAAALLADAGSLAEQGAEIIIICPVRSASNLSPPASAAP
jgi:hypothetical protein